MSDKPSNPNASMFPACWSCPQKIVQPDWVDPKNYSHVAGCKSLTKKKWDKGVMTDSSGTVYQHNCPMKKEVRS